MGPRGKEDWNYNNFRWSQHHIGPQAWAWRRGRGREEWWSVHGKMEVWEKT